MERRSKAQGHRVVVAGIVLGVCAEAAGPAAVSQARSITPRYGDFIVAIDSITTTGDADGARHRDRTSAVAAKR